MTKMEMALLGKEFDKNYYSKYHMKVTVTYKYRGEIKTRVESRMTEEGEKLMDILSGKKIFTCPYCHEKKSYGELEIWDEDTAEQIARDEIGCSECYEDAMGEDL